MCVRPVHATVRVRPHDCESALTFPMRTHHAVANMQPATPTTSQRDGARTSVTPLEFTEPRQHTPSLSLSNTPRCTTSAVADGLAKREVRNLTS